MVFQKPNPFPKSIYDNIAFGPRVIGMKGDMDAIVERALTRAALWDEVKDRLKENAYQLSGGQQQRLCIARCLAVEPDVILMDEPCSALDPIATAKIEDLMLELKDRYSIVIVTHNMQQAARVSDMTAVLMPEVRDGDVTIGHIVEYAETDKIFTNPDNKRTEEYVTGRVGLAMPEVRVEFHEQLRELSRRRCRRSTSRATAVDQAIEAVVNRDTELAVMVIEGDDRIDGRYLDVHQGILSLLARQSPGRQRPAPGRRAAAHDHAHRAHRRPGREHRQARAADGRGAGRASARSWPSSRRPATRPATSSSRRRSRSSSAT